MSTILKFFRRFANQKTFRLAMLLFSISTFLINNPWFGQRYLAKVTNGLDMLDMTMINHVDGMLSHMNALGDLGRSVYQNLLLLDYVLILTLGFFQIISILRLLKNVSHKLDWLILFPMARGIFDGLENILLYWSTSLFPAHNMWMLRLASVFIFIKWIAFWISIAILLGLAIVNIYLIHKRRSENMKQSIKLVILTSSPRENSQSKALVHHAKLGAEACGATVEIIDLYRADLAFCTGCLQCMEKGHCIINDAFESIKEKLYEADGILLSAPTYCGSYNAVMKNFIDRLGLYERFTSSLGDKYYAAISTAGDKRAAAKTAKDLAKLLSSGVFARGYVSGSIGVSARFDSEAPDTVIASEHEASSLGVKLVKDIQSAKRYPLQNAFFRLLSKLVLRPMYTSMIIKNKGTTTQGVYQNLTARNLIS